MAWTRITAPDSVAQLMPAWLGRRMIGLRGSFGLLLATGTPLPTHHAALLILDLFNAKTREELTVGNSKTENHL